MVKCERGLQSYKVYNSDFSLEKSVKFKSLCKSSTVQCTCANASLLGSNSKLFDQGLLELITICLYVRTSKVILPWFQRPPSPVSWSLIVEVKVRSEIFLLIPTNHHLICIYIYIHVFMSRQQFSWNKTSLFKIHVTLFGQTQASHKWRHAIGSRKLCSRKQLLKCISIFLMLVCQILK